ncbi:MAG TPA: carboxymuconolactone decarboxylase family protein [Acidimicrobiales bacterium]|nr:carboxymuconolactone decarboxylase family protein [Acidimicrobiales bacterium]
MAAGHWHDQAQLLATQSRALRQLIPEVYSGYAGLAEASTAAGALDAKTKELIALAIGVAKQCDGCIGAHARSAARAGASRQEVAEALGVTIMMDGGPGTVWAARALAAFDEYDTAAGG